MKTVLLTDCSFGSVPAAAQHFGEEGQNVIATMRDSGASKHLANRDRVPVMALDLRDFSASPPPCRSPWPGLDGNSGGLRRTFQ